MDFAIWFGIFLIAAALTAIYCWRKGAVVLSLIIFLASSQSAMAALNLPNSMAALGAPDSAINQNQQDLEETLKLDPTGDHYKGIEYSNKAVKGQPSDQEILDAIAPEMAENVELAVSNGSVRLSGKVQNRAVAEEMVEAVKQTKGVHEVAFDLGLAE
ncbi:MAG: BON domain-containing protein [Phormidesmis sp.]